MRDYEIVVRINFGAPEHYEDWFGTEEGIKKVIARLNTNFTVYGTRHYEYWPK